MAKLSKSQLDVIFRMQEPYNQKLTLEFPMSYNKSSEYRLNGKKVRTNTIEALVKLGLVVYTHMDFGGRTIHYYRITEEGKKIKE